MAPELLLDDNHTTSGKTNKLQMLPFQKFDVLVAAGALVRLLVQNYELKIHKENYIRPNPQRQKGELHKQIHESFPLF